MAYNLLGQQGNKGDRNPDPNLTAEVATYLYDFPPGSGDNKGLTNAGKPVDKKDVAEKLAEVGVEDEAVTEEEVVDEVEPPKTTGKDEIKNIQQALKDLGFNPGPIDGIVGPRTRGAAQDYIDSLSGPAAKAAFDYYNDLLGGLTEPDVTDTSIAPTTPGGRDYFITTTKPNWWELLGYDTEGEAIRDGMSPSDVPQQANTFSDLINIFTEQGVFDPKNSIAADITDEELEILQNSESYSKAMRGELTQSEYDKLKSDLLKEHKKKIEDNATFAGKFGAWLNYVGTAAGLDLKSGISVIKDVLGETAEDIYNAIRPDTGGFLDNLVAGYLGTPGANPITDAIKNIYPELEYDPVLNRWKNLSDNTVIPIDNNDASKLQNEGISTTTTTPSIGNGGIGGGAATATEPDEAYNAIGQLGPRGQSNEGYEYKFDEPPGQGLNPGVTKIGDPDPEPKAQVEGEPFREIYITIYKDGEERQILESDFNLYSQAGWSRTRPSADTSGGIDGEIITDEVGPGQVVSDQLNTFNNIPQNAILIEAAGQLFLGYEVPGAYGQMYSGEPMFMLYEVLDNDVYEAGILTQGASPQVNVSLGSLADLNQYGIVVGGTDELTDNVEHPFIRFVENFEAGKRVNPWLNDTEINPLSGVSYQQEAIEFLAEQALEQWSPEETQLKYEGTDWYRKSTTTQKQWLTTLLTQPEQATQDIQDKQLSVRIAMEANGIASPPDALVSWFADKAVSGTWTQLYTDQQIALLADPYKPGARDTGMVNFIEGVGVGTLDRLSVGEKTVTDLYRRYLGPSLGNASADEIAEKAGQLRNDPDAEEQLKSYLEQQRLAMFGNYTNPTLTYNDIVQPYKNLVNQVWGQEVDETQDWFIKMVQDNDIEKAYTTLREKGISQGIGRVQDQALNDLQSAIGQGQVAPQLGANG